VLIISNKSGYFPGISSDCFVMNNAIK